MNDSTGNLNDPDSPTVVVPTTGPERRAPIEGPGSVIGHYKLLEQVGEGGFGVVYVAEQREPVKRRVALKIIKLGMDTKQVVARFEAERQALAMMDHPNIAKVLDAGATETGRPYFVMELVRGIKITEYCDQNHLRAAERLELFIQVCHAIQHAHQKGVIHRDIKPSNILVTLHDGVPVPVVIDFGIAKATQQELTEKTVYTQLQQFVGTPAYMSPEQAEMSGLDIDTRSDIYSLGVVLYELLTGKTPFDAQELMKEGIDELRKTIREREPPRPSTRLETMTGEELTTTAKRRGSEAPKLANLLRGDLDWIVMKCLEKDRTRRYETANALAQDILRHLNHEPVSARPPSSLYRFQKLVRRNKLAFAAASAFAGALVIGLGFSTWQFLEKSRAYQLVVVAEREQNRLRQEAQKAQANEAQLRRHAEAQELAARRSAYASDMNLAQQALAANNLGRAQELLNRHRPARRVISEQLSVVSNQLAAVGQQSNNAAALITDNRLLITDLRGWEWRYLWRQCQSDALFSLCQVSNSVLSLSVSHDGKWLAVGEQENGGLSVWDVRTRQEIVRLPAGDGRVRVAFSRREPLLAFTTVSGTWSTNRQFRLGFWDGAAKRIVGDEIRLGGECLGLAFSGDGQTLVTSTTRPEDQITLWQVRDAQKLSSIPASQVMGTVGTFFAVDRNLSVAVVRPSPNFKTIRAMDLVGGKELWTVEAADEGIAAVGLSADGKIAASAGGIAESAIRLWDVGSGKELGRLEGHRGYVIGLLFWPDGKTLASASADQTICLWDIANPTKVPPPRVLRGHKLEVWTLALLPDGATLASGSKDGSVYLWDTSATRRERALVTLPVRVAAWRFAPDSKAILALDRQGRVSEWQGEDFSERKPLLELTKGSFSGAHISPDGRLMATGSLDGTVTVWDLRQGALLREFAAHTGPVVVMGFTAQGTRLLLAHADNNLISQWDLTTWQRIASTEAPPEFSTGAISADERWGLALGNEGRALLRDTVTGDEASLTLDIRQASDAAFSADGKFFAASSKLGFIRVWERETLREAATFRGFLSGVHSVAFSPDMDRRRLVAGSNWKEALKLWDLESRQELLTLEAPGSYFYSSAFSPDGNVLGSVNGQGELHLWRVPSWADIAAAEKDRNR